MTHAVTVIIPKDGVLPSKPLMQVYQMEVRNDPKAYLNWEYKVEHTDCWCDLTDHPNWVSCVRYRRKGDYQQ
jgi:hypothetical protein